jgi:hypothetical protein
LQDLCGAGFRAGRDRCDNLRVAPTHDYAVGAAEPNVAAALGIAKAGAADRNLVASAGCCGGYGGDLRYNSSCRTP